jgi:NAD(P)H-hydrate repair Nnr-like enzyme with NAD(P)H-hydrate epimerase domain
MVTLLRCAELRELETRYADARPPLMERAGKAAAELALRLLGKRKARVLICAGPGNNGGDARVMARILGQEGIKVVVVGPGDAVPGGDYGLVVDGLFGIGLTRPVTGPQAELIARINAYAGPVLALDVPSGIDGDTGRVMGIAVRATHTLSFIGGKPGLYTLDGPDHCGEVQVDDLGLRLDGFPGALLSPDDFHACLKPRQRNSHKGSFGSLAVIGGAPGMTGAALLRRAPDSGSAPGACLPDCCSRSRSTRCSPNSCCARPRMRWRKRRRPWSDPGWAVPMARWPSSAVPPAPTFRCCLMPTRSTLSPRIRCLP